MLFFLIGCLSKYVGYLNIAFLFRDAGQVVDAVERETPTTIEDCSRFEIGLRGTQDLGNEAMVGNHSWLPILYSPDDRERDFVGNQVIGGVEGELFACVHHVEVTQILLDLRVGGPDHHEDAGSHAPQVVDRTVRVH